MVKHTGWCIMHDDNGIPELEECECCVSPGGVIYRPVSDTVWSVEGLGETFFYHKVSALPKLIEWLHDAKNGHLMALAYIDDQIAQANAVFEQERRDAQGS